MQKPATFEALRVWWPKLRSYAYAASSEGVLALCAFALLVVLGTRFGPELVATYLLVRRVVAVLVPAITLGMPLALVRNLVLHRSGGPLIVLATSITLVGAGLLALVAATAGERFTELALGVRQYGEYAWPMVIAILGVALTTISVGVLRARMRVAGATTQMILSLGAIPLFVAATSPTLRWFLMLTGSSQTVVALLVIGYDLRGHWRPEHIKPQKFLGFGAKATLAEFAMMILFWLPPATISRSESMAVSGYFSLILSLVLILSSPIAPVATSVMPRLSAAVSRNDTVMLRRILLTVLGAALAGGTVMVVLGAILYDVIAHVVLGDAAPLGPRASLLMLSAIVPLAILYSVRNAIDVVWSPARNALIILTGIVIFEGTYWAVIEWTASTTRVGVVAGFVMAAWSIAAIALCHGVHIIITSLKPFEQSTATLASKF